MLTSSWRKLALYIPHLILVLGQGFLGLAILENFPGVDFLPFPQGWRISECSWIWVGFASLFAHLHPSETVLVDFPGHFTG